MKYVFLTIAILALATAAFGAGFKAISDTATKTAPDSTISITPTDAAGGKNATNAHWQVVGGEAACVVDGGSEYYTDDDTWMYAGPYNLSGFVSSMLEFDYSLAVADANDELSVYAVGSEPTDSSGLTSPLATYNANEAGTTETLDAGSSATTYIVFRWESDGSGVDDGARLDNIVLYGNDWNAGDEVASGTVDQTAPWARNYDISTWADGETISVGYHYSTSGGIYAWYWAIDEVEVSDDSKAQLFYEDFESGDPAWDQTLHSGTGVWKLWTSAVGRTGMVNDYYAADSDQDSSDVFDVETYTPAVDCTGSSNVELDFLGNFQDYAGDGDWWLNVYALFGTEEFNEDCSDISDWTMVDDGTGVGVEGASLGEIKANFK